MRASDVGFAPTWAEIFDVRFLSFHPRIADILVPDEVTLGDSRLIVVMAQSCFGGKGVSVRYVVLVKTEEKEV